MLELSFNFIKLYARHTDITNLSLYCDEKSENVFILSSNYKHIAILNSVKNDIDSFIKSSETNTSVYRKLISILLPNHDFWAQRNRIAMLRDYGDYIHAAYGW